MSERRIEDYADIIDLPHPVSKKHPPMSRPERAGQFSPFAALTGYDEKIDESARLTLSRGENGDDETENINAALASIARDIRKKPMVTLTYFKPDERKEGGSFETLTARTIKIDILSGTLTLENGPVIPFDDIREIETEDENNDLR